MVEKTLDQGAPMYSRTGMHHHPGWFVHHYHPRILVKDPEGKSLRGKLGFFRGPEENLQFPSRGYPMGSLHLFSVQPYLDYPFFQLTAA
jgi:hypothetical protein